MRSWLGASSPLSKPHKGALQSGRHDDVKSNEHTLADDIARIVGAAAHIFLV